MMSLAMLDMIRRHAYSWTTRAVVILLIAVFAFWGVGTGLFSRVKPVATVDGHRILTKDLDQQAEHLRRRIQQAYGAQAAQALAHFNVREEALGQLIDQQLVLEEARRLGLRISNADLERAISSQRAFQVNGQFNFRAYREVLRANGLRPAEFESDIRLQLLQEMMQRMVGAGVEVSDAEARHVYNQLNLNLAMLYVEIPYSGFVAEMAPTDKQIDAYYQSHREQFRDPARIKMDFIRYDPRQMAADYQPSEKETEAYYQRNRDRLFTHPEEIRARHILIAVAPDATPQQQAAAKAKAENILKQLKAGASFAKLAKKYSADPGTKGSGGELGYFTEDQMVKPFAQAAFEMRPGEMRVVKTQFGFHVIEVEDHKLAHIDTLKEARPQIVEALRDRAGADAANRAIEEDLAAVLNGKKLAELAKKRGLSLVSTPFLAMGEQTPEVNDPSLIQKAFKLDLNQVRVINGRKASYLVKVVARRPSYVPKLADIKAKVRTALVQQMAMAKANSRAAAFIKQVKTPADFAQAAAAAKLQVHPTGDFSRADGSIPDIGPFPEAIQAAALAPAVPHVIGRPLALDGNAYVFEVRKRGVPDDAQWKQAKRDFITSLRNQRQLQAWASFVRALRDRAQIVVHPDLIGQNA
jgi:peptidyl-prolyl cis-trans isomerase D